MVRAYLIRVGMDSVYGGFVSPIFNDGSYLFLPIPEGDDERDSNSRLKTYSELKTNSKVPLTDYMPSDGLELEGEFIKRADTLLVHNDPEFYGMTYGERKDKLRGGMFQILKNFKKGDFIVFYATFFPCNQNFRYKDYSLSELKDIQTNKKQFYIFAFLELKYPFIDRLNYKEYEDEIKTNLHYLRGDLAKNDDSFVLKGSENSGWIKPIRIDGNKVKGNYFMNDFMFQFKLNDSKGLNRCYCEIKADIIPYLLKNKLVLS